VNVELVIFDLDGVIIDSRELHYEALNDSLNQISGDYAIGREEHLSTFDGLPTTKKLELLTKNKGLDPSLYDKIWKKKQESTREALLDLPKDYKLIEIFSYLKDRDIKIAVASNSIRESVKITLLQKGLLKFVDCFYSNEDVIRSKPNPEMYYRCMIKLGCCAKKTIIIEDSHTGRMAAELSGANLLAVKNCEDVTLEKIRRKVHNLNDMDTKNKVRWQGEDMNILIPMAGAGARFEDAGYTFPKPLIDIRGKPMVQWVVESLNIKANYIFLVRKEHCEKYSLKHTLNLIAPNCKIVTVDGLTEGAACTTLLAKEYIDNDKALLLANSDQFIEWDSNKFMYSMVADEIDGGILTFPSTHPKWSYAKLDQRGFVSEVAEKVPISEHATVGIYYWKHGSDYVKYANQMINKNIRVNNEFYVCPVFNEAIQDDKKIKISGIKAEEMWGLGTPEDLNNFLNNKAR
jgi:beta-phosphoglucomutase-like phosphatase (HAD superfamily)/dTDP-glucose pyrophosphorylase